MDKYKCSNFDAAVPGTGPMRSVVPQQSIEYVKYNSSYNYSLKSKSDLNLNPQPEGNVFGAFPKAEQNREGVYAIDTDRGELSPTVYTQVNTTGQKMFQNRLQDSVRPTMKETTLHTFDGYVAPVTSSQAVYSQFIPQYANINGKEVRIGGSSNYGLRTAAEYSYIPGAGPTALNGQALQNPDARIGYTTQRPDENVDGPSTFKGVVPDGTKYQEYRPLPKPTSNGLRFNYNLETNGGSIADKSLLLDKQVDGIENRFTASYQISPLFTNPLNVIWDPDNKGELPSFYNNTNAQDYSYQTLQNISPDSYEGGGYNGTWSNDPSKTSTNAYMLNLEKGVHNERLEWEQAPNTLPGVVLSPDVANQKIPAIGYGSPTDIYQQYMVNQTFKTVDNTYTTLGDPNAGFIGKSVNDYLVKSY
jgi:hypothetical protein